MKTLETQLEELKKALQQAEVNTIQLQGAVRAIQLAIEERDKAAEESETVETTTEE